MSAILELRGLEVEIEGLPILRGVDLEVRPGEILGVVGETGAGKSMTARAILDLLPAAATVSFEECTFGGTDFIPPRARQLARGHQIGFVPQRPRGSLNPVFRVGKQIVDTLRRLRGMARTQAREEALNLLRSVRITDPERVYRSYPHELSGGMCQRVCIAIALAGEPELIIADEPTTGLDVTIQAEILKLLGEVIAEHNAAGMLITHDLGVVADVCDRVAVMYAGRVINLGTTVEIYREALHPYANQLVSIAGSLDSGGTPQEIPGRVPNPGDELVACAFAPRCFRAEDDCYGEEPPLVHIGGQVAFCHHPLTSEAVSV
ncbi:MAG: ABC transporter ATP-binding protein [Acidimicrobiia bacterium]|nr:ABC transporter ATP-binding protein [Acidimicrobiia bacterium]